VFGKLPFAPWCAVNLKQSQTERVNPSSLVLIHCKAFCREDVASSSSSSSSSSLILENLARKAIFSILLS
jgi:hypothetical protein